MPRDLFGQMTRPFEGVGARSRLTVPLSLAAHALAVVAVVVVPLLATDTLPALHTSLSLEILTPVVPPSPPPPRVRPLQAAATPGVHAAPTEAPEGFTAEAEIVPIESETADLGLIIGETSSSTALVPPPPPLPVVPVPIRVGGAIQPPSKVHHVAPLYPAIALTAGIQGMVIISATIDADGQVIDTVVLKAHPVLAQAAVDAVQQWRFTPTRLNGEPVAVVMTVTVNFQLR